MVKITPSSKPHSANRLGNGHFVTIIGGIVLLATILGFILFVWANRQYYQEPFDPYRLEAQYRLSQFSPKLNERLFTILDEDLYAFAGWQYLTTGDLSTINIEHPPLGKYLIGLSIKLFSNQNIGQIFWGVFFLLLSFCLGYRLTRSFFLASTLPLLIMLEPLFRHQLTHSLLDLPQGVFALLYLLVFAQEQQTWKKTVVAGVSLGAVAAIKFPALAVILASVSVFSILIRKARVLQGLKHFSLVLILAASVFCASYTTFFLSHNLSQWFDLLYSAAKIHLSHVPEYPKGIVLEVLFLNHWSKWWEKGWQTVTEWQATWPFWGIGILASPLLAGKKVFKENVVIFLFVWVYFLFLASRLFFPAYLLPILPFGFVLLMLLPALLRRD